MASGLDQLGKLMQLQQMADASKASAYRQQQDRRTAMQQDRSYDLELERFNLAKDKVQRAQSERQGRANLTALVADRYKGAITGQPVDQPSLVRDIMASGEPGSMGFAEEYKKLTNTSGGFKGVQFGSMSPEVAYIMSEGVRTLGRPPETREDFNSALQTAYSGDDWKKRREEFSNIRTATRLQYPSRTPGGEEAQLLDLKRGTFSTTPLPGGGAIGKTDEPLPGSAQEGLTQGLHALDMLDVMGGTVGDVTSDTPIWGRLSGYGRKAGLWAGVSGEEEEAFSTAKDQFRLFAQSMIKGTPSNFDVQTIIATLPDFTTKTSLAKKKIDLATRLFKTEVSNQLSYYTGTNKSIPPNIITAAKKLGVGFDTVTPSVNPWDKSKQVKYTDAQWDAMYDAVGLDAGEDVENKWMLENYGGE